MTIMPTNDKVQLKIMGISYSQLQSGAYALILAEVDGPYRIPVVIGAAEAQSIAIRLEHIVPPRPMTHDLFVSFAHAFGVRLDNVYIYRFEDGIFYSELTFTDGERTIVIDARTSDAIGIALRTKAPIYTTREIVDETGFIMEEVTIDSNEAGEQAESNPEDNAEKLAKLEERLAQCIAEELYEEAAKVSDEIAALRRIIDSQDNYNEND